MVVLSMGGKRRGEPVRDSRVLLFSQRRLRQPLWHASQVEFENVISSIEDAVLLAPPSEDDEPLRHLRRQASHELHDRLGVPRRTPPPHVENIRHMPVRTRHDLFFAVFHHSHELTYLHRLPGWRERCDKAACLLIEQWSQHVPLEPDYLRLLAQFDVVYVFNPRIVEPLAELGVRNVRFLPTAVDALLFSPLPLVPERSIDCYNIGRSAPVTHHALLELAAHEGLTYIYDTTMGGQVLDVPEHRALLANLVKRAQFFFAYRINESPQRRERTGGDEALSTRYFEGAAGGAVMLGSRPEADEFDECFNWPDAVITTPYECRDIREVLVDLLAQPDRLATIRSDSVRGSLLRHDWAHRWRTVLADLGFPSGDALRQRVAALEEQAAGATPDALSPTGGRPRQRWEQRTVSA